jgi:hypothetical protein
MKRRPSAIPQIAIVEKTEIIVDGGLVLPDSREDAFGKYLDGDLIMTPGLIYSSGEKLTSPHMGDDLAHDIQPMSVDADAYLNGEVCHLDSGTEQNKLDSEEGSYYPESTADAVLPTRSDLRTASNAPSTPHAPGLLTSVGEVPEALPESIADDMRFTLEIFDAVPLYTNDTPVASEAQRSDGAVNGPLVSDNNTLKASELIEATINVSCPSRKCILVSTNSFKSPSASLVESIAPIPLATTIIGEPAIPQSRLLEAINVPKKKAEMLQCPLDLKRRLRFFTIH